MKNFLLENWFKISLILLALWLVVIVSQITEEGVINVKSEIDVTVCEEEPFVNGWGGGLSRRHCP